MKKNTAKRQSVTEGKSSNSGQLGSGVSLPSAGPGWSQTMFAARLCVLGSAGVPSGRLTAAVPLECPSDPSRGDKKER